MEQVRSYVSDDVNREKERAKLMRSDSPILTLGKADGEVFLKLRPMWNYPPPTDLKSPIQFCFLLNCYWFEFAPKKKVKLISKSSFGEPCQIKKALEYFAKTPEFAERCVIGKTQGSPIQKGTDYIFPFDEFEVFTDNDGDETCEAAPLGRQMLSCTKTAYDAIMLELAEPRHRKTPLKLGLIDLTSKLVSIKKIEDGDRVSYKAIALDLKTTAPEKSFAEYVANSPNMETYFRNECQSDRYTLEVIKAFVSKATEPPKDDLWKASEAIAKNAAKPALPSAKSPMSDITNWQKVDSEPQVESKGDLPF